MKRAAVALAALTGRIASRVGVEGAFLILATAALSVGASYVSPAGPWIVVGAMSFVTFLSLAIPVGRTR